MPVLDITKQTVEEAKAKLAEQEAQAGKEAKKKKADKEADAKAPEADETKAPEQPKA